MNRTVASIKGRSNIYFQHTIMGFFVLWLSFEKKITKNWSLVCFFIFVDVVVSVFSLWTGRFFSISPQFDSIRFDSILYFIFYLFINISLIHSIFVVVVVWHASYYVICLKTNSLAVCVSLGWYVSDVNVCLHHLNVNLSSSSFIHFLCVCKHIDLIKWCVHVYGFFSLCTCVNKCVLS